MARYVTSLRANARYAHVGSLAATACGVYSPDPFKVAQTRHLPANRLLCPRCARSFVTPEERADALNLDVPVESLPSVKARKRDMEVARVLLDGGSNKQVSRALRLSQRETVRVIAAAMDRAGVRSRFAWGYLLGYEAGRRAGEDVAP